MKLGNDNLDISTYSYDDLLKVLHLPIDRPCTIADLGQAKKLVLQMHPDKSHLPSEYFLFYKRALDVVVGLYQQNMKVDQEITESNTTQMSVQPSGTGTYGTIAGRYLYKYLGYSPNYPTSVPTYAPTSARPTFSPTKIPTYSPSQSDVARQITDCAQKKVSVPATTCCVGVTGSPGYCNPGYDCISTGTCLQRATPTQEPVQAGPSQSGPTLSGPSPSGPSQSGPTSDTPHCDVPAGWADCGDCYVCTPGYFCTSSVNHTCASTTGLVVGIIAAVLSCGFGCYRIYRRSEMKDKEATVVATNNDGPTIEDPAVIVGGGGILGSLSTAVGSVVDVPPHLIDPANAKIQADKKAKKKKEPIPAPTPTLTTQANQSLPPIATTAGGPRPSDVVVFDAHHGQGVQMPQTQVVAQPSAPAFQLPQALPPNWIVQTDPASGAPFFVQTPTGQTQWNPPV